MSLDQRIQAARRAGDSELLIHLLGHAGLEHGWKRMLRAAYEAVPCWETPPFTSSQIHALSDNVFRAFMLRDTTYSIPCYRASRAYVTDGRPFGVATYGLIQRGIRLHLRCIWPSRGNYRTSRSAMLAAEEEAALTRGIIIRGETGPLCLADKVTLARFFLELDHITPRGTRRI